MNIFVISDTHKDITKALELYERVSAFADIDLIIHCGDYQADAKKLSRELGIEVVSVPGNCDGYIGRQFKTLDVPGGKILITHGDYENVKYSVQNLLYFAEEQGCNIVCFGHTHQSVCELIGDIRLINPGSPTKPRDGSDGSCALLVCEEDKTAATIIKY